MDAGAGSPGRPGATTSCEPTVPKADGYSEPAGARQGAPMAAPSAGVEDPDEDPEPDDEPDDGSEPDDELLADEPDDAAAACAGLGTLPALPVFGGSGVGVDANWTPTDA